MGGGGPTLGSLLVRWAPHMRKTCWSKLACCKTTQLRAPLLPSQSVCHTQANLTLHSKPEVPVRPALSDLGARRPHVRPRRTKMLPGSSSQAPASHPLPDCPSQRSSSSAPGGDPLDEPFSPNAAALLPLASSTPGEGDFRARQRSAGAPEQVSCSFTADALARLPRSSTPPCGDPCAGQPAGAALHFEEQSYCSGAPCGDSIPAQPSCGEATAGAQASRGAAYCDSAPAEQRSRADMVAEARLPDSVPSGEEAPVAQRCGPVPGNSAHRSSSSMLEDRVESAGNPDAALAASALQELHASRSCADPVAVTGSSAFSPQARALGGHSAGHPWHQSVAACMQAGLAPGCRGSGRQAAPGERSPADAQTEHAALVPLRFTVAGQGSMSSAP